MENANQPNTRNETDQSQRFGRDKIDDTPPRVAPPQPQSAHTPSVELEYWRSNYQHRPYVEPGAAYEEYAPAYRYGWEAYTSHAGLGHKFDDLEEDLKSRWELYRGKSKLGWDRAKEAARDAWHRIEQGRAHRTEDTQWTSMLHDLLQICMDGAKGYELAADKLRAHHADQFRQFGVEREQCANELRAEIERRGGEAKKEGDLSGAAHRGWINLKAAITSGEKAVIDECERGEDVAVAAYQKALNDNALPPDLEVILTRHYRVVKNAHDQVAAIKHAMESTPE